MTQMNDVDIEKGTVNVEVFSQTDAALSSLRQEYSDFPSPETEEGYDFVKKGVSRLTKLRTSLDAKRKEIKAPYLEAGRIIDAEAKRITAALVELEDPMKAAKKEVDDREKRRKEELERRLNTKIQDIRQAVDRARGQDSDTIAQIIQEVDEIDTTQDFYHLSMEATLARDETLKTLNEIYIERMNYETAQEEAAEARRKAEEQERVAQIDKRLSTLKMIPMDYMEASADEIQAKLTQLENYQLPPAEFGDRWEEAASAKVKVQDQLANMLSQKRQLEDMQQVAEAKKAEEAKTAYAETQATTEDEKPEQAVPGRPDWTGVGLAKEGADETVTAQVEGESVTTEISIHGLLNAAFHGLSYQGIIDRLIDNDVPGLDITITRK